MKFYLTVLLVMLAAGYAPAGGSPSANDTRPVSVEPAVQTDGKEQPQFDKRENQSEESSPTNTPAAVTAGDDEKDADKKEKDQSVYEGMAILTETLMQVRRNYVEELSFKKILEGALDGMLRSLDPYSRYMRPEQFAEFSEETEGHFTGVGLEMGLRNGVLTVIAPIDGSPAYRAGIIAGDHILRINGRDVSEMSVHEASSSMRGKEGEPVTLFIGRQMRDPFELTLTRESIVVSSVRGGQMLKPGIGYLRITKFDEQTMPAFRNKIDLLGKDGLKALVLDLRSNPGGLMNMAEQVAEQFLQRGMVVVSVKGRSTNGAERKLLAKARRPLTRLPLAILIDKGSASAAEVVAGALQDHKRAVLFGERSFGKASVQAIIPLSTDPVSGIRLTTAYYHTPAGRMIHGNGIEPDIKIELTQEERIKAQIYWSKEQKPSAASGEDQTAATEDPVLYRAVDVLAALVTLGAG